MFDWTADDLQILGLSLKVALVATCASVPLAAAVALLLARGRFVGRGLLNALIHLPLVLPPVVTGYVLLRLLGRRRANRRVAGRHVRPGVRVSLDRRCRGRGGHGVSADGAGHSAVDRKRGRAARGGRIHARRRARLDAVDGDAAARAARHSLGHGAGIREGARRVRRDDHVRVEHPGETQTLALAIYTLTQSPGGDVRVVRLAVLSIVVSLVALLIAETLSRRAAARRS